jgi:hypothetical protein
MAVVHGHPGAWKLVQAFVITYEPLAKFSEPRSLCGGDSQL